MSNEKHVLIDRDQYELQTAELCDLRAKLARLYEETPITGEWLLECGGRWRETHGDYSFGCDHSAGRFGLDALWIVRGLIGGTWVRTRGEFLRAAELLGIQLAEEAKGASSP